ncbi:VanZ family protein [Priestia taiwanensis]|uniref:Permease n=1 Tax=Priestia taiwanensis TaxID=1347902 RepID=A0A917AQ59_9BACI|nr:VanZ family protein [Priestia taiwanensis]MBM7362956.1 glycopeptide antibiotics resistance protein/uncharacterized RDD family membrane protein YckC [Priestia taiwanensis]GGE66433.1 permease [Priestia taiwanensis]
MGAHAYPIKKAIITFPVIALALLIPFLIFQYRKYGYINKLRSVILYSLLFYSIVAFYLVILPLPKVIDTCSIQRAGTVHYQLQPFTFVQQVFLETNFSWSNPATYLGLLKERAFLQAAFNSILLLPLGVYLRYYFGRGFMQTVFITFLASLFFEVTQATALYGTYTCPYRLFDVDDLLLNTFGGAVGYWIAPVFTYFLPEANQLDAKVNLATKPVGYVRRLISFWIDWVFVGVITLFIEAMFFVESMTIIGNSSAMIALSVAIFLYFIVLPTRTEGYTFGKWLLRARIQGKNGNITFKELLIRYGLLYYGVGGVNYVLSSGILSNTGDNLIKIVLTLVFVLGLGLFVLHVFLHLFKRDKRLFYEKISGTYQVIAEKKSEE